MSFFGGAALALPCQTGVKRTAPQLTDEAVQARNRPDQPLTNSTSSGPASFSPHNLI